MINTRIIKTNYGNYTERYQKIRVEINKIIKKKFNDVDFHVFYTKFYAKKKHINLYSFLEDDPNNIRHINENLDNYVDILRLYRKYYQEKFNENNLDFCPYGHPGYHPIRWGRVSTLDTELYKEMMDKLEILEFQEELNNSIPVNNISKKIQKF